MTYTILMAFVLIVSFALMFALVNFSEAIIIRQDPVQPTAEDGKAIVRNG